MKKELLSLLLTLLPLIAFADSVEIDGIYYNLISKIKTAEVTYNPDYYKGVIAIPDSVKYEGDYYVVTSIGVNAFYQCYKVTSVTIPRSVKDIKTQAFYGCWGLSSITISEGVNSIGSFAFWGCQRIKTITLPVSITEIGSQAFDYCDNLDIINISSLEAWCKIRFDDEPLYNNRRLFLNNEEIVDLVLPDKISSVPRYAFRGCSSFVSVTLPEGLKKIDEYGFDECSNITTVSLPNSLDSICISAFNGCKKLAFIEIPRSVSYIGLGAFSGCSSLESIIFPDSLRIIDGDVCRACTKLLSIKIPTNIHTIGHYAFQDCPELKDVYCYAKDVPQASDDIFLNSYVDHATLHVREKLIETYKSTSPWNTFKEIVKIDIPKYTITYSIDGEVYKSYEIEEGESITPEPAPTREGYTFSGWSDIPETMPAHDVIVTGSFEKAFIPGDANGDGLVNVTDIVATVNFIMEKPSEGFNKDAADLNGDGKVNVTDIVMMVSIIMDGGNQ